VEVENDEGVVVGGKRRVARLCPSLVACAAFLVGAPAAANELTRGPFLQLVTARSATVVWKTADAAPCVLDVRAPGIPSRTISGDSDTTCAVPVDGLLPGTTYTYVTRAGEEVVGSEASFRTDDPTAPFTFIVVGDHGTNLSTSQVRKSQMATSCARLRDRNDVVRMSSADHSGPHCGHTHSCAGAGYSANRS